MTTMMMLMMVLIIADDSNNSTGSCPNVKHIVKISSSDEVCTCSPWLKREEHIYTLIVGSSPL